jgi:2-polyprenyl-6-methoxyphenol hydroxylase-like FAD-dependent oxidoreductase
MRKSFEPDEGLPIWNGAILWRGVTRAKPYLSGKSMFMAGHQDQKFVCYPIKQHDDGTQTLNWIAELRFANDYNWRREDWNRAGQLNDFLPQFESWVFDWLNIPDLIRNNEQVYEFPMVDRDPLSCWTYGRATLLGDAAHAMYPIGSNGASQGILDARVLTREIQKHGLNEAALASYEAERRPATSKIVLANRGNGPEQVMQQVEDRAPDGFDILDDVISQSDLDEVAKNYKKLAGFDKDILNKRSSFVVRDEP